MTSNIRVDFQSIYGLNPTADDTSAFITMDLERLISSRSGNSVRADTENSTPTEKQASTDSTGAYRLQAKAPQKLWDTFEDDDFMAKLESAHKTCALLSTALERARSAQSSEGTTRLEAHQALYSACRSARSSLQPLMGRTPHDPQSGTVLGSVPVHPQYILLEHTLNNVPTEITERATRLLFASRASIISDWLTQYLEGGVYANSQ